LRDIARHRDDKGKVFTCPHIFGRLSGRNVGGWAIFDYNREPDTRADFPVTLDDESD